MLERRSLAAIGSNAGSSSAFYMPNTAASESMSMLDDSDSSEDELTDETGPSPQCPISSGSCPPQRGNLNAVEDPNFWSLLSLPPPSSFGPPHPPMPPVDTDNPVPGGGGSDPMESLLLSPPRSLPVDFKATIMEDDYFGPMAAPMSMNSTSDPFDLLPQSVPPHNPGGMLPATAPISGPRVAMPSMPHSKSLPIVPSAPLAERSGRTTGMSTPISRTTIELENVPQDTLSRVMDVLYQARAKVRMETTHEGSFPGTTLDDL